MTRSYKGYRIQTVTRVELGKWEAWAKIVPDVSAVHTISPFTMSKNGYPTGQEAEQAVWEEVKRKIDAIIR